MASAAAMDLDSMADQQLTGGRRFDRCGSLAARHMRDRFTGRLHTVNLAATNIVRLRMRSAWNSGSAGPAAAGSTHSSPCNTGS